MAALALVGAAALAGCTGGSEGDGGATTSSSPSHVTSVSPIQPSATTTSASGSPTGSGTSQVPTASSDPSTPVATASVAQPPDPVVEAGNAGAWTLTRAAPGAPAARQVASLQCGQDGSVTAAGLQLTAGAASLTLTDPAVTVTGNADLDAAGGTFRGRNADTAVTFTWTC